MEALEQLYNAVCQAIDNSKSAKPMGNEIKPTIVNGKLSNQKREFAVQRTLSTKEASAAAAARAKRRQRPRSMFAAFPRHFANSVLFRQSNNAATTELLDADDAILWQENSESENLVKMNGCQSGEMAQHRMRRNSLEEAFTTGRILFGDRDRQELLTLKEQHYSMVCEKCCLLLFSIVDPLLFLHRILIPRFFFQEP